MTPGGQPAHPGEPAPAGTLPELLPDDGSYAGGLTFALREYQVRHDGNQILSVAGLARGETVGLEICLGPEWEQEPHLAGTILAIQLGSVSFRSLGPPSDALVRLLARLYQTDQQTDRMRSSVTFIGIALEGDPTNLAAGTTRIKLSHEAGDDGEYFDLLVFVDLPSGLVQLREKDSSFRRCSRRPERRGPPYGSPYTSRSASRHRSAGASRTASRNPSFTNSSISKSRRSSGYSRGMIKHPSHSSSFSGVNAWYSSIVIRRPARSGTGRATGRSGSSIASASQFLSQHPLWNHKGPKAQRHQGFSWCLCAIVVPNRLYRVRAMRGLYGSANPRG